MSNIVKSAFTGIYQKYKLIEQDDSKKKTVYLLGQGWLAKGFIDYIDKNKFYIINISRHNFVHTPLLLQTMKNHLSIDYYFKSLQMILRSWVEKHLLFYEM